MQNQIDLKDLIPKLPPLIARDRVAEYLGGVISAKTLANLDSLGDGPSGRMRIGRKIVYRTEDLLEWLEQRSKLLV